MKSKLLSIIVLPLALSCTIHSGTLSTTEIDSETIFKDSASGISEAKYFLNLGGLSKNTMINEAKRLLYLNRPLQKGEAYANFAVDIERTHYFIFSKQTVTVSADIIEETSHHPEHRFTESFKQKLYNPIYTDLFKVGDKVMEPDFEISTISRFLNDDQVFVISPSGKEKKKRLSQLFNTKDSFKNVKVGSSYSSTNSKGKVVAVGIRKLVILDDNNEYKIVSYQ